VCAGLPTVMISAAATRFLPDATLGSMDLEAFELVFLRRPPDPPEYDEETLDRIQGEHLAYLAGLRDSGVIVTNGPVIDQPDEALRGLAFYCTGSLADARALADQDPAVRAGRLVIEVMTWWCPRGTMTRAGRSVTVPDP
jgi:uncharacterized protein